MDSVNSYHCICPPGYTGTNCQHRINPCDSSPCLNNGHCNNQDGSFHCNCEFGFTGPRCEVGIVCYNFMFHLCVFCGLIFLENMVVDLIESHLQHSKQEQYHTRVLRLQNYITWCGSQNPCRNGARCQQNANQFTCECLPNWTGPLCDIAMVNCQVGTFIRHCVGFTCNDSLL